LEFVYVNNEWLNLIIMNIKKVKYGVFKKKW
jgi:hypothetical protein